ncbi:Retrograde regulation protein [Lachnellula occidentalis]|uniref:Retrograde regulation protein n=1 Tax=Lachnellula occidentalis TaxID=215460 RepID=A0A8H8RIU7_9HELO|nr:Retrograde regulation protein [Lachnellula occidentalis]
MAVGIADEMEEPVTISNFESKMSRFKNSPKSLYGLVDMGSNGIRFSISDLSPPRSRVLHCLYRDRVGISLYDALLSSSDTLSFPPKIISEVAATLARFKHICDTHGVPKENINVFATEAMRTASNREKMLAAIQESSGLTVGLLSPEVESLFGAMGARSGFDKVDGLFMDLGGGSVQMTYVNSSTVDYDMLAAEAARSMPYGAAKVSAALQTKASEQRVKTELRQRMKETFDGLTAKFPKLKEQADHQDGVTIYFCGGGFRGYGSMLMHTDPIQPYPIPAIGGYTVEGHRFIKWREMLHANNTDERKIFGLSKRRREQFPAIVTVVQALVEAIPKIKQVTFCSGGNREGVLHMKLPAHVRESNPLSQLTGSAMPYEAAEAVAKTISSGFTTKVPGTFSPEILHYVVQNTWLGMGESDDSNSAKALHEPISGTLAGLPGLTHELRAILALTMCSRWGSDLGPIDQQLAHNLQELIGHDLTWWCRYVGTLAKLIATIYPAHGISAAAGEPSAKCGFLSLRSEWSHGLGKKGHKHGIRLVIYLKEHERIGISMSDIESMFAKVGKGLRVEWRVEAEVMNGP